MYIFEADGNYVNFKDGSSLVRRLHSSSKCIDWGYDDSNPSRISFTVDEIRYDNIDIANISFDGVACTALSDFETGVNTMFPPVVGYPAGTKMYMALLSQSGTSSTVELNGTDSLTKGVTYEIIENGGNVDLSRFGAPNNEVGTKFCSILTGPVNGDGPDSIIIHYDPGAPVANVLVNTVGNLVWSYADQADYLGTLTNGFPLGKTIFFPIGSQDNSAKVVHGNADSIEITTSDNGVLDNIYSCLIIIVLP